MAVLLLFLVLLLPLPAEDGGQLVVHVRDERGEGVAGIVVTAHAPDDQSVIAQAHTDATGQAVFPNITAPRVHILLTGTTATGVPLRLQGHDADGIALHLNGTDTTLALRVERSGVVIVDPISWAQEPVMAISGATVVTTASISSANTVTPTPAPASATPTSSRHQLLPLLLLFALLGFVAMLVLRARRAA